MRNRLLTESIVGTSVFLANIETSTSGLASKADTRLLNPLSSYPCGTTAGLFSSANTRLSTASTFELVAKLIKSVVLAYPAFSNSS